MIERFSQYRVMWLMVFFDLPTTTKPECKVAAKFRDNLQRDGFTMFQFSVYIRHCASAENAEVHAKRVRAFLPDSGKVAVLCVTDKQFADIEIFYGHKPTKANAPGQQLELF